MKRFDDEELVAHYLHDLPPEEADTLERALQVDPALAARYQAYAAMLDGFKAGAATMVVDETVTERNWRALEAALPSPGVRPRKLSLWRYPLLAGAGLAFAATGLFFLARTHTVDHPRSVAPIRQADGTAPSVPDSADTPMRNLAVETPGGAQIWEEQHHIQARSHVGTPLSSLPTEAPQTLPPRRTASLPPGPAAPTVLHLIPLASASLPTLLPPVDPNLPSFGSPQTTNPKAQSRSGHSRMTIHSQHPADLTFAMGGSLIGTRDIGGSGTGSHTVGATHAVSALVSFHQQIKPALGYRVAISYSRPDFLYGYSNTGTSGFEGDINGRIYELAATYVVQGPHRGGLSTSVEAGGGFLAILPTQQSTETRSNLRAAGVVGVAADYPVSKHLGLHLAYRAQVYQSPDFNYTGAVVPVASATVLSNEPMVGITYRFHSK